MDKWDKWKLSATLTLFLLAPWYRNSFWAVGDTRAYITHILYFFKDRLERYQKKSYLLKVQSQLVNIFENDL